MKDENNWYEARLDKIFTNGALWKHCTFRTILDPLSSEWNETDFDKKLEILERVVASGEKLSVLIRDYKRRYDEQDRRDITLAVENALIILLQYRLMKKE
jgi:hypothetical protein